MQDPIIVRVPILPFRIVNAHLVCTDAGVLAVDAGLPDSLDRFSRALDRVDKTLRDIRCIVVTHAHVDHAGGAQALHAASGAPIVAHASERAYLRGEAPMQFCCTGCVGRLFYRTPLVHQCYAAVEPDVEIAAGGALDLRPFGFAGVVRHAGGHTCGSLSVELASGDALVGDLLASGIGIGGVARLSHAIRPPFEDDPARVATEIDRIVAGGGRRFHLGHGGPVGAPEACRHADRLRHVVPSMPRPQRMAQVLRGAE